MRLDGPGARERPGSMGVSTDGVAENNSMNALTANKNYINSLF